MLRILDARTGEPVAAAPARRGLTRIEAHAWRLDPTALRVLLTADLLVRALELGGTPVWTILTAPRDHPELRTAATRLAIRPFEDAHDLASGLGESQAIHVAQRGSENTLGEGPVVSVGAVEWGAGGGMEGSDGEAGRAGGGAASSGEGATRAGGETAGPGWVAGQAGGGADRSGRDVEEIGWAGGGAGSSGGGAGSAGRDGERFGGEAGRAGDDQGRADEEAGRADGAAGAKWPGAGAAGVGIGGRLARGDARGTADPGGASPLPALLRDPSALRLALLAVPRSEPVRLDPDVLEDAARSLARWRRAVAGWARRPSRPVPGEVRERLRAAWEDDLDLPAVLGVLRDVETAPGVADGARFETFAYADRLLALDLARDIGGPV
ncbi:hypothetical protein [Streptomyces sp. NPDC088760]|uniref:hypothetical protein n=1 Tax=Streptomyces sp. NPDC088760 TaxID=3365890 RepID=UPI0037F89051